MVTGRFRVAGIRQFEELPVGAFFVLEKDLRLGGTYWVEEGFVVAERRNVELYQRKVGPQEDVDALRDNAIRLAYGSETFFAEVGSHWVTLFVETKGKGPVWTEGDVEVSMTTFGQLPEGSLFIRVCDLGMRCPVVWRKRDEEGAVAISEFAIGEYRDETRCESLERVKPVREDHLIRIPELHW